MKRVLITFLIASAAFAQSSSNSNLAPIRDLLGFKSKQVPRNDDGSAPIEQLGFTINFFGKNRSQVYVNNNGNVTFDSALATYTPFGLNDTHREIIAPFFADVDTRNPASNLVTYGRDTVNGRTAFGVNYISVGYYNSHADKLNSFQVILIDRSDTGAGNFDIEFNYKTINWETGDASQGVGGIGGVPATVGWSNGTGDADTFFQYDGSLVSRSFLDSGPIALKRQQLNSGVPGRLIFRARDGKIIPPLTILTGCPVPDASLRTPYSYQLNGAGGGTSYQWSIVPDPGTSFVNGMSVSPNGLISGTPTQVGTTSFTLELTAATESGPQTVTRRCSLTVDPPLLNIASSCPLPSATAGKPYLQTLRASGGTAPYVWSLTDNNGLFPAPGLQLSGDGTIAGTPVASGTYVFTLQVASNSSDQAQPVVKTCSLTVEAPVLDLTSSCSLPSGTAGVPYIQGLTVNGGVAPYTWSISGALPSGLTLDPSGIIYGTPAQSGNASFTATVTDASGRRSSQNCSLPIANPSFTLGTSCPLPTATVGSPYSQSLSIAGGNAPFTWALLGALPQGLSLSQSGAIQGTPYNAGIYNFRILMMDGTGNTAAQGCSITVKPSQVFSSTCPLPLGTAGVPYQQQITLAGGTPPYVVTTNSVLPAGITLNSFGLVSGTPQSAGTYPVIISVQDSLGNATAQACTLTIQPSPVQITGACPLTKAQVGVPYKAQFGATGGTPPYAFFLEGALPAGLSLSRGGLVSGTPTIQGATNFDVRVVDSNGITNVNDCSVAVGLPSLPQITFGAIPSTFAPAVTGPAVTLNLSSPYSLPIQGTLRLADTPNTGDSSTASNQSDPHVQFANGQLVYNFTLAPGQTQVKTSIPSTGTVASQVTITADNLKAGGSPIPLAPNPISFSVPQQLPSITTACVTQSNDGASATITGFTTTRSLANATFTYNVGTATKTVTVDVSGSAQQYFSGALSIPTGGAFTVQVPFGPANTTVSNVSVIVTNNVGASASANLGTCQ